MSLKELADSDQSKYEFFEAAVREYGSLPLDGHGQQDRFAREPIYGYAIANFGWERSRVRDEMGRIAAVTRLQQVAGTKEEREKLLEAAEKSKAEFKTAKPALEKKIREAQLKLKSLEKTSRQFDERLSEAAAAADKLQTSQMLPRCVNAKIRELNLRAFDDENYGTGAVVQDIELEICELEAIIAGPVYDAELVGNLKEDNRKEADQRFALWLQQIGHDGNVEIVERTNGAGRISHVKRIKGLAILQAEAAERLPHLKKLLSEAQKAHEKHDIEVAKLKTYYLR